MSYTVEKISMEQALEDITAYRYALIYEMSEILFCETESLGPVKWDECLEARFFDEDRELHIYEEDGRLCAVRVYATLDDDCLMKKYTLQEKYFGAGKYLCVCEHLEYDEDGQAMVALTRLAGIA